MGRRATASAQKAREGPAQGGLQGGKEGSPLPLRDHALAAVIRREAGAAAVFRADEVGAGGQAGGAGRVVASSNV